MTKQVAGPFDVKVSPMPPEAGAAKELPGRMLIDKKYHGALEGTGQGQMLALWTAVEGSGVYVALEHVRGTLEGRQGTFALQHAGTMVRGKPTLVITVIQDSGTGELEGLQGTMTIDIAEGGKHSYGFQYTLPEKP
jgi:hypothetical protein